VSAGAKLRLSAEILSSYCRVRWALRRSELGSIVARLRATPVDARPLVAADRHRLASAVGRVLAPLPTDSRCLTRSLVLLALLERRGVAGTLVIGVRPEPLFAAHAWVECEGEPLLPNGAGEFARLTVL
jgi:hypothetical protein